MTNVEISNFDYDFLCVGTSSLMALEAIFLAKNGAKVIMVDKDEAFGGAWKTIEMAGIKDIENAIHYFLPNKRAIEFMRNEMKWPIEKSQSKYRYFHISKNFFFRLPYDSSAGRIVQEFFSSTNKFSTKFLKNLLRIITSSKTTSFI